MTRVTAVSAGAMSIVGASPLRAASSAFPSAGRCAGSFLSAASASAARSGGASGRNSATAGGAAYRCMFSRASASSATNGNAPVSIRKRITPNE